MVIGLTVLKFFYLMEIGVQFSAAMRLVDSYDAYRKDLVDSANTTLQQYGLLNLSNAILLEMVLQGLQNRGS